MPDVSLLTDLSGFYRLEESTGTRFDSHNDNDLTDINTVGFTVGVVGSGASFNISQNERLDAANSGVYAFTNEDFTLACWVRLNGVAVNQGLMSKWDSSTNRRSYLLAYIAAPSSTFLFEASPNGTSASVVGSASFGTPSVGDWNFVVGWHDSVNNTINIQVNNGTVHSLPYTAGVHLHNPEIFKLGKTNVGATDRYLDGALDAAGVWRRVLTSVERTQLYNNGNGLEYPFYTDFGLARFGGYLLSAVPEGFNRFGIFGGYLETSAGTKGGGFGGYILTLPLIEFPLTKFGGIASGQFFKDATFGGFMLGAPSSIQFAEAHARTLVKVRSRDVVDQNLNIDATMVMRGESSNDFNAKFTWFNTSETEFDAKYKVERYKIRPTVQILSVTPTSGVVGSGCAKVTVVASGTLGDGSEWVNAQIDFGEPLESFSPRIYTYNASISGFNSGPPWTSYHDYCSSGIYIITIRGQDNLGMVGMDSFRLNLASGVPISHLPQISISGIPQQGFVPGPLQVDFSVISSGLQSPPFTAQESNNTKLKGFSDKRIIWSFGNRQTSQRLAPTTFYASPGLYIATLRYLYINPSGGNKMWVSDRLFIDYND